MTVKSLDIAGDKNGTLGDADEIEAPSASFEQSLNIGKNAFEANDFAKAREAFRTAADIDADNPEPHLWLCRVAYRQYDWMDLYSRTTAYLARKPDDRETLLLHARACNGLADWSSAARAWGLVAEDRPDWPEARFQKSKADIRLGERETALSIAEDLVGLAKDSPEAGAYAVRLLIELEQLQRAREAFEALFRRSPDLGAREFDLLDRQNHHRGLAIALRARQTVEGVGRGHDERLLNVSETLFRDAIGHERAGDLLGAYLDYDALHTLSPDDGLVQRSRDRIVRELRFRAEDQLARQNLNEAATAFARATQVAPSDGALMRGYGRALMRLREWDKAAAVWSAFLKLSPGDGEGALQLARALDRSGRLPEAVGAWRAVLARLPDNEEAAQSLSSIILRMIYAGRAAITEERFLDAYQLFSAVVSEAPDNEEGRQRLDQVGRNLLKAMRGAYKAGNLRTVLSYGPAASDLLPNDAEVQLLIARAANGMRRPAIGLRAWTRLAELDPENSKTSRLQIARCLLHLGSIQEGQQVVRSLLAEDAENADARDLMERFRSVQ